MNKYIYSSNFKQHIINFLKLKHSIGYKYETAEIYLNKFDKFCIANFPDDSVLNENLAMSWATKQEGETFQKFSHRVIIIREFAKYIISTGDYAYVIPSIFIPRIPRHESYIYSFDELKRFFYTVDNRNYNTLFKIVYLVLPVLFRILYCCGLRVSEVLNLKVKDIDFKDGILTIRETKNNNDRLVPISQDLKLICKQYYYKAHISSSDDDYFFYNTQPNQKFPYRTLLGIFKQILNNSDIKSLGKYQGPRIHDFRHTFAVHCFNKLISECKDLSVYQPVLKTYMGHASFKETTYYIKLTDVMYSDIIEKSDVYLENAIPNIGGVLNEK